MVANIGIVDAGDEIVCLIDDRVEVDRCTIPTGEAANGKSIVMVQVVSVAIALPGGDNSVAVGLLL